MATAYLALGSNLGNRESNLSRARRLLTETPGIDLTESSALYLTRPVGGPPGQDDYFNAVLQVETRLSPPDLLQKCLGIENRMKRDRPERWAPRIIDIDLLLYDDLAVRTDDLELPHPRMQERVFVLLPLADLAPDLIHPPSGRTIRDLLEELPVDTAIERIRTDW